MLTSFEALKSEAATNFRRGTTEMLILALLSQRDYHAYGLVMTLKEMSNHTFITTTVTTAYTILKRLVAEEFVSTTATMNKPNSDKTDKVTRVIYHLLPRGRQYLDEMLAVYKEIGAGINNVLANTVYLEQAKTEHASAWEEK